MKDGTFSFVVCVCECAGRRFRRSIAIQIEVQGEVTVRNFVDCFGTRAVMVRTE